MRELTHDVEQFTDEELALMASNGVTGDEVREFIRTSGPQNIDTAIPGVLAAKAGVVPTRNEPFSHQGAVEGNTETGGVESHPVNEEPAV